jgi:protoporphyrinogen oxidase
MQRLAIIGAGVSGLSAAHFLRNRFDVVVFEKEMQPGGLIRCKRENGALFHVCGGHVFNTKRQDVLHWFWSLFDQEKEFSKADRNSVVYMDDDLVIPYPIENHVYFFDSEIQRQIIKDLILISKDCNSPRNFEEFLRGRFGETLYSKYFQPYNEKVWRRDLKQVPLSWLEGKLPMPSVEEILFNNMNHIEEKQFVHSSFWYPINGGSQFIADRMANGQSVIYGKEIKHIRYAGGKWQIDNKEFDKVVFCGNLKEMVRVVEGVDLSAFVSDVEKLEFHGTTSVFCQIDKNPYSWIYQPNHIHQSHRIICTGNFSVNNNSEGTMTGTVEFTDEISKPEIIDNLTRMPLHPRYLTHSYNKYTYPIQDQSTRLLISEMKEVMKKSGFYFTGRFADWEYYNMDAAIGAAMNLCETI